MFRPEGVRFAEFSVWVPRSVPFLGLLRVLCRGHQSSGGVSVVGLFWGDRVNGGEVCLRRLL